MTDFQTPEIALRIRIKELPRTGEFEGYDVSRLRVGQVYDIASQLAALLIVAGLAETPLSETAPAESVAEAS